MVEIILAEGAGFCSGVKRAVEVAFEVAKRDKEKVYTLGPLIHNSPVVHQLAQVGVKVIEDLGEIESGTIIFRSHGVSKKIYQQAREKGLKIVDATCPIVKRVQKLALILKEEGYNVVIVGERTHPEVVSIYNTLEGEVLVIREVKGVEQVYPTQKVGVIAQTTQDFHAFQQVVTTLLPRAKELRVFNTICEATTERQRNSLKLAKFVDLILVVGGHNSANTNRLANLCREMGTETHLVEFPEEIDSTWLRDREKIGLTGGTSTPIWLIEKVKDRLEELLKFQRENSLG